MNAYQLQLWTGREYVEAPHQQGGERQAMSEYAASSITFKRWRIVLIDKARPVKGPGTRYRRPAQSRACSQAPEAIRHAYMDWARRKGLTSVAVYRGVAMPDYGIDTRPVDVDDFLGDAPEEVKQCAA